MATESAEVQIFFDSLRNKELGFLESVISRIRTQLLLLTAFQFFHSLRPYNAYNEAVLEEALENKIFENSLPLQGKVPLQASVASKKAESRGQSSASSAKKPPAASVRSSPLLRLLKLLLYAKADMLQRVCVVLERDLQTMDRLSTEQTKQVKRLQLMYDDFGMRLGHMDKMLQLRTVQLIELRERVNSIQNVALDGTFVWCIDNVQKRKGDAVNGKQMSIYSPAFYVHRYGYKMCLRLYLNGDGLGKSTHVSLFVVLMRSACDAVLRWPFQQKITLLLYDQNFRAHIIDAFRPDQQNPSFKRPENMMNIASGSSLFVPLCMIDSEQNKENAYIKDDRMYVKIIIDCSDLPSLEHIK